MRKEWKLVVIFIAQLAAGVSGQLEQLVLGGVYGSSFDYTPNLRDIRDRGEVSKDISGELGNIAIKGALKLSEILEKYATNHLTVLDRTHKLVKDLRNVPSNPECELAAKTCPLGISKSQCYLQCITLNSTDEHVPMMVKPIADIADVLCKPLKTSLDRIFADGAARSNFKIYSKFLTLLGTNKDMMKKNLDLVSNAVLGGIVKHTDTPLSPLKHVIKKMEDALDAQFFNMSFNVQNNPKCPELEMFGAYDSLVESLTAEPALQDILLPGFALANTGSKYISTKASFKLTAFMEIFRIVSGSSGGFGCTMQRENNDPENARGICDELGRSPLIGYPMPLMPGNMAMGFSSSINQLCKDSPMGKHFSSEESDARPKTSRRRKKFSR